MFFKPDGTRVYILDGTTQDIFQFDVGSLGGGAWDIDAPTQVSLDLSTPDGQTTGTPLAQQPRAIFFKPDGTRVYIMDDFTNDIIQFDLTTAWDINNLDIASGSADGQTTGSPASTQPYGLFFKSDGTRVYILDLSTDDILQYDLATAWDINSLNIATADGQTTGTSAAVAPIGLFFKPDGTRVYITDNASNDIMQWDLSTAWDIDGLDLTTADGQTTGTPTVIQPEDLFFNATGTRVYILDGSTDDIFQFDLTTAWDIANLDISSGSSDGQTTGTPAAATPTSLFFNPTGTRVYITDDTTDDIFQYDLAQPWTIKSNTVHDPVFVGQTRTKIGVI
jgi:DNA-binding beta-propeller fold protein YncE